MRTIKTEELVAGAGALGMAAALFLKNRGIAVEVVEAEPSGGAHSYALGLHASTIRMLADEGVDGSLAQRALGLDGMDIYCDMKRIMQLPGAECAGGGVLFSAIGQNELESCFDSQLRKHGVQVRWNHRLASFQQSADGIVAEVDEIEERMMGYAAARLDRVVGRKKRIACKYMVAADGHHSLVRRQLAIAFLEVAACEHFAVFEFPSDFSAHNRSALIFNDKMLNVFWPLPDNMFRWSFQIDPGQTDAWTREKDRNLVQILGLRAYPAVDESLLRRLLAERAPWFDGCVDKLYWRMLVRFEKRLVDRFGEGRIWMAGDAGHMTHPAGIQSMNVGIRESHDLAVIIAKILREGKDAALFKDYDRERQTEWRHLLGLDGPMPIHENAHPCLYQNADRLRAALPASGADLETLCRHLQGPA